MAYIEVKQKSGGTEYLINDDVLIPDTYINDGGGTGASSYYTATDFIEVSGGETIKFAVETTSALNAWYDSTQTHIEHFSLSNRGYMEVTAPANAKYMRLSGENYPMSKLMAWRDA